MQKNHSFNILKFLSIIVVLVLFLTVKNYAGNLEKGGVVDTEQTTFRYDAADGIVNSNTALIISDDRITRKQGISLKTNTVAAIDGERQEPDLTIEVKIPAGRYTMYTYAVTDVEGAALMKKAKSKFESIFMRIQIDNKRPTKRVVYVPWDRPRQESGKFDFSGEGTIKLWLPRGVILEYVQLVKYVPPKVPDAVQEYNPSIVPPNEHPRLWLTSDLLPQIKERLTHKENQDVWLKVKDIALKPYIFDFDAHEEITFQADLERAAEAKAFYYLMTNDKKTGREAVELMASYMAKVEFGNLLDITRERGRAIYYAALVYDWCYDLLTAKEKISFSNDLVRQADDMEIGWPPFKQSILTGHGNEAQVNRDLLSMSIAIYDENPEPYKYCAYRILEELVPMRGWQYQSHRHNQGINYGAYRSVWDMHAAFLFYRMTGNEVFNENIKKLPEYWLYMRMPDGQMLRDGDGFNAGKPGEFYYWKHPLSTLLFYAYSSDPVLKAEYKRQGKLDGEPVLFLLLNDPDIEPEDGFASLPLTKDFGTVLGGMIARTGWDISLESNDVVAEIKGGGYHFGNHQHSDAGSMQVYYRGLQVADLGLYGFYGTPYDMNFNKRSVAHSMVLVRDPEEKFLNTESNDGGTRLNQRHPDSPQIAHTDSWFHNGTVVSSDFGPADMYPEFSYFSVDLTSAYSSKLEAYTRQFCFINLGLDSIPAAIILTDDIIAAKPEYKKFWQINTHNKPELSNHGFILHNKRKGLIGRTHVEMLIPNEENRKTEVLSGEDANSSFGFKYEIPSSVVHLNRPEANGHRIMVSPLVPAKNDRIVAVFQMTAGKTNPLPVDFMEEGSHYIFCIADKVVVLAKKDIKANEFTFNIANGSGKQILLAGLKSGNWRIRSKDKSIDSEFSIKEGKNTIFLTGGEGVYTVSLL